MNKKILFLLALLYTVALLIVSLIKTNSVPNVKIPHLDKMFHFASYMLLSFLWYVTFFKTFNFEKKRGLYYAVVFSILFGIIVEVLQTTLTSYRSGDVYDVLANTTGVLFTVLMIVLLQRIPIKK